MAATAQAAAAAIKAGKRSVLYGSQAQLIDETMIHRAFRVAAGLLVAACLIAASPAGWLSPAAAQSSEQKPADEHPPAGKDNAAAAQQKINEYAEAQKLVKGPAGNPECMWLGSRILSLLYRDDLDTAFRHLDLYDRFGCPGGYIQVTFRCLVLHSDAIDSKKEDSLSGQVHACWLNPAAEARPPQPAAAASPAPAANPGAAAPAAPAAPASGAATNH